MTIEQPWLLTVPLATAGALALVIPPIRRRTSTSTEREVLPLVLALDAPEASPDATLPDAPTAADGPAVGGTVGAADPVAAVAKKMPLRLLQARLAELRGRIRRRREEPVAASAPATLATSDDQGWDGLPELVVDELVVTNTIRTGILVGDPPSSSDAAAWQDEIARREAALAAALAARDVAEAALEAERRGHEEDRAAAVAAAAARETALLGCWFRRLDPDLASPSSEDRVALVASLALPAPWAGKLLRAALADEQEPVVRARILGALVAGGHLEPEPFVAAFACGGVERAAVREALGPYRAEHAWIGELFERGAA